MLAKSMLKHQKAISPILATLLLIVIAVAAIVVTYAWIMTYMSSATQQAGVMLYKANVNFYGSGTKIDIDIGNSGDSNTQIVKVYVGTAPGSLVEQDQTTPSLPASLNAGSITSITATYNWTTSTTYYFKVISSTGQTLGEFPEQAPTS
jgi:flagellin-like protein